MLFAVIAWCNIGFSFLFGISQDTTLSINSGVRGLHSFSMMNQLCECVKPLFCHSMVDE